MPRAIHPAAQCVLRWQSREYLPSPGNPQSFPRFSPIDALFLLAELGAFLDLDPHEDDIAVEAFDRLGFPHPAEHYGPDAVRALILELERRYVTGAAFREYDDAGFGLLYYQKRIVDADEAARVQASERFVREIAGSISARFVGPWP